MPRQIAPQVVDSVSRLLSAQYLKTEPLWYKAVTEHPPSTLPPRSFRDSTQKARYLQKLEEGGRPTKKERRLAQPRLSTTKMTYLEDKVRDQFYHDHPWEGKRPRILLETEGTVSRRSSVPRGKGLELRHWGRNPGPEDVIAASLELHQSHGMSLSAAYHHTLSSYYALRAEHENATRYAVLEAVETGAQLDRTETQRSFAKEKESLHKFRALAEARAEEQRESSLASSAQRQASSDDAPEHSYSAGVDYLRQSQELGFTAQ